MSSGEGSNTNSEDMAKSGPDEGGGEGIPIHLLKSVRKGGNGNDSGGSSNGGNYSDNSALVSIGNTSFGFNFDSEEHTPNNSDPDRNENSEDSDDQQRAGKKKAALEASSSSAEPSKPTTTATVSSTSQQSQQQQMQPQVPQMAQQQPRPQLVTSTSGNSSAVNSVDSSMFTSSNSSTNNDKRVTVAAPQAPKSTPQIQSQGTPQVPYNVNNTVHAATNAGGQGSNMTSHNAAAADAVANLHMIATSNNNSSGNSNNNYHNNNPQALTPAMNNIQNNPNPQDKNVFYGGFDVDRSQMQGTASSSQQSHKRKADEGDSSAGYHTDDEGRSVNNQSGSVNGSGSVEEKGGRGKKKKRMDERKREERNLREKERSLRISKQINELRDLLSTGGVIVPKGTKSSVLTEAANYIRMLQQHQYRSELDRHQLIQQMQMIGNGAHGAQAARAVRHVAAQNGVWSLGNFGGVPPSTALSFAQPPPTTQSTSVPPAAIPDGQTSSSSSSNASSTGSSHPNKIENHEYKFVFNSCGVGIAIASLGGAFMDCNQLFCQLSSYSKQEVCGLTIFNLTARQDLQHAFDLISQMISPPIESRDSEPKPIVLRGSMKTRSDIGLCISLVRGEDGIARCFSVILIKNPSSPFDTAKPIPVSFDAIQTPLGNVHSKADISAASPAFTLG